MGGRPHALVWPTPHQGHINALMQLSQHLTACHGFRITFLNTEHNHTRIMAARSKQSEQQRSSPSYPEIDMVSLPDGLSSDNRPISADLKSLAESIDAHMLPLVEQLICAINLTEDPITCIIADAFCHSVHDIAERAGVSCVIGFFPCSAAQLCCIYHVPLLLSTGQLNPDGTYKGTTNKDQERITGVPGLRDMPVTSLMWQVGTQSDNEFLLDLVKSTAGQAKRFKAILFNSYYELEKAAIDALIQEDLSVFPVGPLLLLDSHEARYNVARSDFWVQEEACLKWLDDKPESSVLYIAFGSIAIFDIDELHALAHGLEASGHNFLWVLRPDLMNGAPASLPVGFRERTKDRGFLTSWAPQASVLSHASVGGFLTHCGWNSIMEAIAMGVPMLTWPYFGEQRANCTYIVEEWEVGMSMLGRDGKVVDKEEVEKIIRSFLSGVEREHMSKRMASLKEKAAHAIEKGVGASYTNLRQVVNQIVSSSIQLT